MITHTANAVCATNHERLLAGGTATHRHKGAHRVTHRRIAIVLTLVAVAAAACSNADEPSDTGATMTPDPVVTAPPTMSEEERVAAEIEDVYRRSVASLDQTYAAVASWDPTTEFPDEVAGAVERAHLVDQADLDERNSLTVQNYLQANRGGDIDVVSVDVSGITSGDSGSATVTACLDLTGVTYVDVDGDTTDLQALIAAIDDESIRQAAEDYLIRVDGADYQRRTVQMHNQHESGAWRIADYTAIEDVDRC